MEQPLFLKKWYEVLKSKDIKVIPEILADEVVFYSPVVFKPVEGKKMTTMYLAGAFHVLSSEHFKYTKTIFSANQAVLEFETIVDGIQVQGVDIFTWNENNLMTEMKVMLRPLKAINIVHQKMGEMLLKLKG